MHGYELAYIGSSGEQNYLWGLAGPLPSDNGGFWTALNDNDSGGRFEWERESGDISLGSYTRWAAFQPDSGGLSGIDEDCVEMRTISGGRWNDLACRETRGWICELDP